MAALFLCRDDLDPHASNAKVAVAGAQFVRHGFRAPDEIALPGWRLLHSPAINGGPDTLLRRGPDLVAVAGTLTFDGRLGAAALERLLDAVEPGQPFTAWDRIGGHFVALVHKGGQSLLFTDFFGAFQLFHNPEHTLFSTSLLSMLGCLPRLSWQDQGVYEYAFNVFPLGEDTVFNEVKRLGPDRQLVLGSRDEVSPLAVSKPLPNDLSDEPAADRVARAAETLRRSADPFVATFGDRMDCPLSGGFDSRLALALLRSAGVRPHVYVYGPPDWSDVRIAKEIGRAEGFEVEAVDKWATRPAPDAFPGIVERNFHEADALATDGSMFDTGGNAAARRRRQRDGRLTVSGGCGEIFRNFFFLPDRPMRARAVVDGFYSTYTTRDTTGRFDPRAYRAALEAKVLAGLGVSDPAEPLPRQRIEQAYPRIRCRSFFGREISLVNRFGAYFMPFLERPIVADALTLPMSQKAAGRFQAQLITAIDPVLARYPSTYGHSFDQPPSAALRRSEAMTCARPLWLRRRSYALKRRLGPVDDGHGGLITPDYLGRVIDLDFPVMRTFFRPEQIGDNGVIRRVAKLEYLAAWLGSKLA